MKRTGRLFQKVFSMKNLHAAYLDARRGKRKKRACFEFERNLGANLTALHEEIISGAYSPAPYFKFTIYEPKERTIHAPVFRDIVAQHAIYRVIYPIFDRTFISTSFACRKGLGTHAASDYVQAALRSCHPEEYTLKLDIKRFFYRIDRGILQTFIERKIKDERLMDTMAMFAAMDTRLGIPIGNLLSQTYALIYLNPLDHFIKRELRVRHYARYVDDFILIGLSRPQCLDFRAAIIDFLKNNLKLELSKSTIQKVKRGLNFVGYRTWESRRLIRKHSLFRFRRNVRRNHLQSVISLLGHARRTSSLKYLLNQVKETNHALYLQLPKSYRRIHNLQAQRTQG